MSQQLNGIEVLQWSNDLTTLLNLPAVVTDTWYQADILYWDTSSNTVKKFAPADSTAGGALQRSIIGIASAGKSSGENTATAALRALILADASHGVLGATMNVKYDATTLRYSFQEDTAYDSEHEPDVTLTLAFATCFAETTEKDRRMKIRIDGLARYAALT
jgi:hypothetical protein